MMLLAAFQLTQPDDALKRAKESEGGEEGVVGVEEGRGVQGGDGDQLEHWLLLEQEGRHLPGWFLGGLQPAVVVEPLLVHRGGGSDVLELHKLLGEVKLVL